MTPNQSLVLQGYCAVLMVIATMAIPLFIWVSGKRLAAAQYVRDLQDLINQVNLLALQSTFSFGQVTLKLKEFSVPERQ